MTGPQETPLILSKRELRAAAAALERMRAAQGYEAFFFAWQDFIDHLEKTWKKVERDCQRFQNKFQPWQGQFKNRRRKDPLLCYLYQARNADQHTLEVATGFIMLSLQVVLPPLASVRISIDAEKNILIIAAVDQAIQYAVLPLPKRFYLFTFTTRGRKYQPATEHLGEKVDGTDPLLVAEKGLAFYQDFLRKAEKKFFPTAS